MIENRQYTASDRGVSRPAARAGGRRRRRRHEPRHRVWFRVAAGFAFTFAFIVSWSVGHALTMPGGGTVTERLAEWARDHYLGPVVTLGEWLSYQPPKVGGKPSFPLTGPGLKPRRSVHQPQAMRSPDSSFRPPPRLKSFAGRPVPGEGIWRVAAAVHGEPAIYVTYLRASRVYSSYVAGIAVMNQGLLRFGLRPGTEDPGPGNWKALPYIAPGTRRGLVATFNSGFKVSASGGGFYLNGASAGTLTDGVASEVYYRNGRLAIGVWGRTVHMSPDVVAVRQNLHLIVSHGRVPRTVDANIESSWGATLGGGYYVWRSGIGITRSGRIVYVYGPALDVRQLADLLQRAGAVTAMQLDINPAWMSFMYYRAGHHPQDPSPVNLLPTQNQPPNRYYATSSRDFTVVFAR